MKPEDVTKEMEVAFRQNVITTNRGSLIGLKAAIAAAINAMPQSAAQAQIDAAQEELRLCKQDAINLQDECIALKAERDALRAEVKEWLCTACNTVYPGPPAQGFSCVVCPNCHESAMMPRAIGELRMARLQLGAMAAPSAPVPEGWQLVPVEPTEAMLNGARDWSHDKYGKPIGNDAATGCYRAMLAAKEKP